MIPETFNPHGNFLFSYDEYKNNPRSKRSLRVRCLHCGKEFLIAPNELERKFKEWRKRCEERGEELPFSAFRFCSKECARDASPKHQTVELVCAQCGKHFTRRKDVANLTTKSGEVFCSKACHAAWRKANNVSKGDKFVADISQNPNGNFLFTQEEYEATLFPQSRYKKLLPIRCLTCGHTFMASAKQVNNLFTSSGKDKLTLKYCSRACRDKGTQDRVTVTCANCGKKLERQRYELDVKEKFFCDRECMFEWLRNNPREITGGVRSKLEKLIEYLITELLPNVKVEYNNRQILHGLELDQYYPDFNVGVEINGGWHFLPLGGDDQLELVQNHDIKKVKLAKDIGLPLLQIPIDYAIAYTPSQMVRFVEFIAQIVDFINTNSQTLLQLPPDKEYRAIKVLYQHREEICTPSALRWIKWSNYLKLEDLEPSGR